MSFSITAFNPDAELVADPELKLKSEFKDTSALIDDAYTRAAAAFAHAVAMRKRRDLSVDYKLDAASRLAEDELRVAVVAAAAAEAAAGEAALEYNEAYSKVEATRDLRQTIADDAATMKSEIYAIIDKFMKSHGDVSVRHGSFSVRTKTLSARLEDEILKAQAAEKRCNDADAMVRSAADAVFVLQSKASALAAELRAKRDAADADDAEDAATMSLVHKRRRC